MRWLVVLLGTLVLWILVHPFPERAAPSRYCVADLSTLDSAEMCAVALNNAGQIILRSCGSASTPAPAREPARVSLLYDGVRIQPIAVAAAGRTLAWSVNDEGVVVGDLLREDGRPSANCPFLWDAATREPTFLQAAPQSPPRRPSAGPGAASPALGGIL